MIAKKQYIFVDVQGFKIENNEFILKEFAIATPEYTQAFLIKPPYSYKHLSPEDMRQVNWLERNRGISWSEGCIDYREFRRIIASVLRDKNMFVKGEEKCKWIRELCGENCDIIELGGKGCPNFVTLYNTFCKKKELTCCFHKKICALKNVICMFNWFQDNNLYQFDLFSIKESLYDK